MIETTEAIIIYDALSFFPDVVPTGGHLAQEKNVLTGEFSPDRQIFPMSLDFVLKTIDPNLGNKTEDVTSMLTVNWYRVTTSGGKEVETEIVSTSSSQPYYRSGNTLIVQANVEPGTTVVLRARAAYVDPHTQRVTRFVEDRVLSSRTAEVYNPSLEVDIGVLHFVCPFVLTDAGRFRTVTARFFSGSSEISNNAGMVYEWKKLDGNSYRTIEGTDVDVASVSGRTLVLDLACINRSKFCLTAYFNTAPFNKPGYKRQYYFTVERQLAGFSLKPRVFKGKFLRMDTEESEAEAVLTFNSNQLDNPSRFFRIGWSFYLQSGTAQQNKTFLGYGNTARAGRSLSGYDGNKVPTFQMDAAPFSEYRLLVDDVTGDYIVDDTAPAQYVVGQFVDE